MECGLIVINLEFCLCQSQVPHQKFLVKNKEKLKHLLVRCGGTLNSQLVATTSDEAERFQNPISKNRTVENATLKICKMQSKQPFYGSGTQSRIHKHTHTHIHHHKHVHVHHHHRHHKRVKRSISTRIVHACYTPGTLTDTSKVRLCKQCWATREFGAEYYPRYINEVLCDQDISSPVCFRGKRGCSQKQLSLVFFKNIPAGSSNYETITVSIGVGCECELNYNSGFIWFF